MGGNWLLLGEDGGATMTTVSPTRSGCVGDSNNNTQQEDQRTAEKSVPMLQKAGTG